MGFGDGLGANGLGVGLDDEVGVYLKALFGSAFRGILGDIETVTQDEPSAIG